MEEQTILFIAGYLIAINAVAFVTYGIDKIRAINGKWRLSEASLIGIAVMGGSVGSWIGMKVWRHKTKHAKFVWGIPIILILQLVIAAVLICNL